MQESVQDILDNYRCAERIKRLIALQSDDAQRLLLIKYLLHYNCNHITGKYSDEWIEQQVIKLADKYVQYTAKCCADSADGEVLVVMTAPGATGGHTALINNWMEFDTSRKYSIVFTEVQAGSSRIPAFLRSAVEKSGGHLYFLHGEDEYQKASELLCLSECFEKVVLNIHMYDVIPLMAYSNKNWTKPIYFYNHANFLFSIGVSISDCYLTLCSYDACKARKFRGAGNVQILKMPMKVIEINKEGNEISDLEVKQYLAQKYHFDKADKIILSMGNDFKYTPVEGYDFAEFARALMNRLPKEVRFFIIGADREKNYWKQLAEDTEGKVQALGILPREEVTCWMRCSAAYVTSFPMTAAGRNEANRYGIPSYTLQITKRIACMERNNPIYYSVNDMIEDICKYFERPKQYKHVDISEGEYNYSPPEWCRHLNRIFNRKLTHRIHAFKSRMIISKEEKMNVQLLDEKTYPFYEWEKLSSLNKRGILLLEGYRKEKL